MPWHALHILPHTVAHLCCLWSKPQLPIGLHCSDTGQGFLVWRTSGNWTAMSRWHECSSTILMFHIICRPAKANGSTSESIQQQFVWGNQTKRHIGPPTCAISD